MKRYTHWMRHGEDIYKEEYMSDEYSEEGDDMQVMLKEAFGTSNLVGGEDKKSPKEGGSPNSIGDDVRVHKFELVSTYPLQSLAPRLANLQLIMKSYVMNLKSCVMN